MKKQGILNSKISKVLADMGHTDYICISDCGLPIPENVKRIDLALKKGTPSFIDVLNEVNADMVVEKIVLANEIKEHNQEVLSQVLNEFDDVSYVTHEEFKKITHGAKAIIRTGECTPYANIILKSGVNFN